MAVAQTIQELTGSSYNELRYNAAGTEITGNFMRTVCNILDKCGVGIGSVQSYNSSVEAAVRRFQGTAGLTVTGVLNNATWQTMLLYANKYGDIIDTSPVTENNSYGEQSDSAHFNSFFEDDNLKTYRRNRQDIKIVFGNKNITKTIKDVFMRSVSVEVDTSGNPISEIYEFIARDVVESDEIMDAVKYTRDEDYAAADIQYVFNIGQTK